MTVFLESAYAWECPACKHRNFEMPIPAELLPAEAEELREVLGVPAECGGDIYVSPSTVECRDCGQEFDSRAYEGCGDEECQSCTSEYNIEDVDEKLFQAYLDEYDDDDDDDDDTGSRWEPSLN